MSEPSSLTELSSEYLKETLFSITEVVCILSVLCFPLLFPLATDNVTFALFGVLGVLGLAIYFGQELALQKLRGGSSNQQTETEEEGLIAEIMYLASVLLYHNMILFIGIVLGSGLTEAGYPLLGILAAFSYPVFDTYTANRALPLSLGGFASFIIWILSNAIGVAREMSWSTLGLDRFSVNFVEIFEERTRPRVP